MSYIRNQNTRLYYEVVGQGTPMIMLNGFGNCVEDWYELGYVDALKNDYQLILMDGRGFGKSDKPHDIEQYDISLRVTDVTVVLDALEIKQAIIFGSSVNAATVYALMGYCPERFLAYVALGLSDYVDPTFNDWFQKGPQFIAEQMNALFDDAPQGLVSRYAQNDPRVFKIAFPKHAMDFSENLSKIDAPVLLYAGEHDQAAPKIRQHATLLKQGRCELLSGLDHCQAYWQGAKALPMVKQFLQERGL